MQDLFINETAKHAHVLLPGTSFLEKDGTFTNAERRINRVRPVDAAADRQARVGDRRRDRCPRWARRCPTTASSRSWTRSRPRPRRSRASRSTCLDKVGSVQWPCNDEHPLGTPTMHEGEFARGKGQFVETPYVPTTERSARRKYPLILTTGRILSQYNVGAQTRRTANVAWHPEDLLEIHPHDAEDRGIPTATVTLASRVGETTMLRAKLAERMPLGVVYTTFHHPVTGANVVTTENSDWATNCPEYKVTAVQVGLAVRAGRRRDGPRRVRRRGRGGSLQWRSRGEPPGQRHRPQRAAPAAGRSGPDDRRAPAVVLGPADAAPAEGSRLGRPLDGGTRCRRSGSALDESP